MRVLDFASHILRSALAIAWAGLIAAAAVGLLLGSAVLLATQAGAQEDSRWVRQVIRQQYRVCDNWDGSCYYRVRYRQVYRPAVRYYAAPRRDRDDEPWERRDPSTERGVHCKGDVVRVVGGAHLTKEGATNDAIRQWQSTVRYDFGEKWMDIENARGYRWRCDRASTNETVAGRIGEAVGAGSGFQKRCVVIATPCMMPVSRGDKDEKP